MATNIEILQLHDPLLEFGGVGEFTDPKEGLKHGGPFDLRFGSARRNELRVGFIGNAEAIEIARNWLIRCQGEIPSSMSNLTQYPHFLGFRKIFRSSLEFNPLWDFIIDAKNLNEALNSRKDTDAFKLTLELFSSGLEKISNIDTVRPDVIFCCLSDEVVNVCWSIKNEKVKQADKKKIKKLSNQLLLFDSEQVDPIEEQEEDILNRDFRRALKARAMKFGIPIQIGTSRLFLDSEKNQDAAIRAWNSSIALYYKAGGIPWRLRKESIDSCFVGISFHHLFTTHDKHLVRSCIAQAFSSDGEGFAIRGANIPWSDDQGTDVHLTEEQAFDLGERILNEYRYRTGTTPLRVVMHKSTSFNENEKRGLYQSLNNVPIVQLVNLAPTDFRLVRFGEYPPKRGTLCTVNNEAVYLFATGYMDALKTYPGPHIPVPLRVVVDKRGDEVQLAQEILALSRMNWNTSSITGGAPVTLLFSRRVGGIMAEFGDKEVPPSSFRFYL